MYLAEIHTNSLLCQRGENIGKKNSLHFSFYTLQEVHNLDILSLTFTCINENGFCSSYRRLQSTGAKYKVLS
jgi:hypothetical protein